MIKDIIGIYNSIESATDKHSKKQLETELRTAVEAEIKMLFKPDSKYPKGQRSFEVIKQKIGIFDSREDELKEVLFRLGARRRVSSEGKELWEFFPTPNEKSDSLDSSKYSNQTIIKTPPRWAVKIAGILVGIGIVFTALNYMLPPVREFTITILNMLGKSVKPLTDCAKFNGEDWLKCKLQKED